MFPFVYINFTHKLTCGMLLLLCVKLIYMKETYIPTCISLHVECCYYYLYMSKKKSSSQGLNLGLPITQSDTLTIKPPKLLGIELGITASITYRTYMFAHIYMPVH